MDNKDYEQVETPALFVEEETDYKAEVERLKKQLAEAESKPENVVSLENMVANDPNAKLVETSEGKFLLKKTGHAKWLKYFGKIMKFTVGDNGKTEVTLDDFGKAAEFVFQHMLVRPKVTIDDIKDFSNVMAITSAGISLQMTEGN